jgi:hypothetical protein
MRRLLLKLILVTAPFAFYAIAVFSLDPFDYFRPSRADERALKASIAGRLDPPLWKLLAYRRAPRAHILLGDSRMNSLGEEPIASRIGSPVANLAYGGGSLHEAIRTFWVAAGRTELKSVTIGINLNTYDDKNAKDRVGPAEAVMHNPALYLSNRLVALGMWHLVRHSVTGGRVNIGRPPVPLDQFWRYQLEATTLAYSGYRNPNTYRAQLAQVADECARRHIALQFVIFPEHADLIACATRSGLASAVEQMRSDLKHLGRTFDFSLRRDWSDDRSLFLDPLHFTQPVADEMIDRVWGVDPN